MVPPLLKYHFRADSKYCSNIQILFNYIPYAIYSQLSGLYLKIPHVWQHTWKSVMLQSAQLKPAPCKIVLALSLKEGER